jgi:hypothetical protein
VDDAHDWRVRTEDARELTGQRVQHAIDDRLAGAAGHEHPEHGAQSIDREPREAVGLAVDQAQRVGLPSALQFATLRERTDHTLLDGSHSFAPAFLHPHPRRDPPGPLDARHTGALAAHAAHVRQGPGPIFPNVRRLGVDEDPRMPAPQRERGRVRHYERRPRIFGGEGGPGEPEVGGLGCLDVDPFGGNPQPRAPEPQPPVAPRPAAAHIARDRKAGAGQVEADLSRVARGGDE